MSDDNKMTLFTVIGWDAEVGETVVSHTVAGDRDAALQKVAYRAGDDFTAILVLAGAWEINEDLGLELHALVEQ